ncbi:MAG: hypothetical protein CBB72_011670 [Muricauda sp. TMED12]|nr:MAG: hypothetical protein CBB72_011670 [Muricauda sp. TMED12]
MVRAVHYVGCTESQYQRARQIFGGPAYYHKWLDDRVWTEVGPKDTVVIAKGTKYNPYVWDASAVDKEYTQ